MEKTYNPHLIQEKYITLWDEQNSFATRLEENTNNYCVMLPPPNVTGSLHMGHAFQQTIMDILIRTHKMLGDNTLWQAGTDHAGIATQMVVERQLLAEDKTRHDLGREKFLERVWQWKEHSGGTITHQMRKLGTAVDWSRERFTMDEGLSAAVSKVFVDLYNKGLIYRGKRLVNWDPVLQTAVSDLEVISEEENGQMYYVRYPFAGEDGHMLIATTRPETILADGALAVNPNDERYAKFVGKQVHVPLTDRIIPIVVDDYVDPEFGTGCVKITPAHDFNDWEVGTRHEMEIINLMHPDGSMNENCPEGYQGLDRFEARKQIIQDLDTEGLLKKVEPHKLKRPRGDRTGAVIEPYLTDQWFVRTEKLAKRAVDIVKNGDIRFVPKNWEKTYFNWLEDIQDWCISRQIWWGHRIPAYFADDGTIYVANSLEEAQQQAGEGVKLTQDSDVLDTWFSSALWPFSTLGWPQKTPELDKFYPTSVLVTGFDIIFFWVARMIMFGLEFTDQVPFKDIYITGLVRDGHGHKMSKSKGNVLDPLDIIYGISLDDLLDKRTKGMMQPQLAAKIKKQTKKEFPGGIEAYGADALRFNFAATASFGRDIKFDLKRVEGYRNFCNKLWNAARFVFGSVDKIEQDYTGELSLIDKWILSKLQQLKTSVAKHRDEYRFDLMAQELYDFVWHDYCDWYLELSKAEIENPSTQYTLVAVLQEILLLLHPIIPFITEEIFASFGKNSLLIDEVYPSVDNNLIDKKAEDEINYIQEFVLGVRKIRSEMNIAPNKKLGILVENTPDNFENYRDLIIKVAKLENITNKTNDIECATAIAGNTKILIPLVGLIDKDLEIARLNKEISALDKQIGISNNKLGNEKFVANAKAEIVAVERERLAISEEKKQELVKQLNKTKEL
jgi:valyl-tRNA synthetase